MTPSITAKSTQSPSWLWTRNCPWTPPPYWPHPGCWRMGRTEKAHLTSPPTRQSVQLVRSASLLPCLKMKKLEVPGRRNFSFKPTGPKAAPNTESRPPDSREPGTLEAAKQILTRKDYVGEATLSEETLVGIPRDRVATSLAWGSWGPGALLLCCSASYSQLFNRAVMRCPGHEISCLSIK